MQDLTSEIEIFHPDEDTPLRNGHLCIVDKDISPFFSPLSLSLLVGLGVSCWFPGFLFLFLPLFLLLPKV